MEIQRFSMWTKERQSNKQIDIDGNITEKNQYCGIKREKKRSEIFKKKNKSGVDHDNKITKR